jgi:hypothetical protein
LRNKLQAADISKPGDISASDSGKDSVVASSGEENIVDPERMVGFSATP